MTYYYNGTTGNDYFNYGSVGLLESLYAYGYAGDDTLFGGDGDGSNIDNTSDNIYGGDGNDYISGGYGNNYIDGGAGNDSIYGGDSYDTLIGGDGNDYISDVDVSFAPNRIYGGAGNDTIYGGGGIDTIDGGAGVDKLIGGSGDDIYYVDNVNDVVIEFTDDFPEFTDTVYSSVNYTLSTNLEFLILTGSATNGYGNSIDNTVRGNANNNYLYGYDGNDFLNGGAAGNDYLDGGAGNDNVYGGDGNNNDTLIGGTGVDTLIGGAGDDIYYVDNIRDVVTEFTSAGTDTVNSSVNYTLSTNLEFLILTGSATNGYGNSIDNTVRGNANNNYLYGYDGNDFLNGGAAGNDYLDGGAGNDNVYGGDGNNNDTLIGGTGVDTLIGGAGDDIYYVDNIRDVVTEFTSAGTDTVNSSVTYTLSANVENLTLTGSAAINGTGNGLNNRIQGNSGNNSLIGGAGNDTIIGGAGNDTIVGGAGKDVLTGGTGTDKFTYTALSDSLFASYDVITDYTSGEQIDRVGSSAVTLTTSVGRIASLTAPNISALLTSRVFTGSSSKAFTVTGVSGTFLAFNDATAGYNSANDSIIFLQNYTLGSVSIV